MIFFYSPTSISWCNTFSRFLTLKPNTRNDEKLFLAILEFLRDHELKDNLNDIVEHGKENILHFLTRDQPESGMDLLLKGQEKAGQFLLETSVLEQIKEIIWDHSLNPWSLRLLAQTSPDLDQYKSNEIFREIKRQKPYLFTGSSKLYHCLIILDEYMNPKVNCRMEW